VLYNMIVENELHVTEISHKAHEHWIEEVILKNPKIKSKLEAGVQCDVLSKKRKNLKLK